jgi:hypothetical protein
VDDTVSCLLEDLPVPNGSGDTACLEKSEVCTGGANLGQPCTAHNQCPGANNACGSECGPTPLHLGMCNSPTRTRFSGAGPTGSGLFLSTIQIGTISDDGTCAVAKQCAGGTNSGAVCAVNGDCPGGGCASAICNGLCSNSATTPCLVNANCPAGGVCNPGATFNVPCAGADPENECGANAVCRAVDPAKGFDGVPCTADDPPTSQGVANTIPQTTGVSHASVADAFAGSNPFQQLTHRACYPSANPDGNCVTSSQGSLFDCGSLLGPSPSVTGVKLTTVFPTVDGVTGDAAIATLLQAR